MSSKNPTGRPKKVAGRARPVVEEVAPQPSSEAPVVEEAHLAQVPGGLGASRDQVTEAPAVPEPPTPDGASRATLALVLAIVVLVAVALVQVAYLWGPLKDDATVSSSRPVLISKAAEQSAADTAAKAAVAFTARSYETYDEQVDTAAAMMTTGFAEEFRQTTDDAKDAFVAAEAEVTADVVAQAVMTASAEQVEVLIFLNQFTTKKDAESVLTPFRLKVTLIDAEQGWLVSDVQAS